MARKLHMQAETGSRLLSHLPVSGHYKHPLPVLAVPLLSSGSSVWVHKASSHTSSSPWMAGDSQDHGITTVTKRRHYSMWVKYSISTLAASTVPSLSLEVQGTSSHCATAGEPAPAPGDEQPTTKSGREKQVRIVLLSRTMQWQGVQESYTARSHPNHPQGEAS